MTRGDISAHLVQAEYKSLASLRDAHLALKQLSGAAAYGNLAEFSVAEGIRAFLSRARRTGRFLSQPKERRSAQGILDYWSAELAALPGAASEDFAVVLLDPFDPGQPTGDDQPRAPDRSGEGLIRFSAFAREWQASGKDSCYLLKGNAIDQAARYRALDSGIEEFVRASEEAQARKRRDRRLFGTAMAFGVLMCAIGVYLFKFYYLPRTKNVYLAGLTATDTGQKEALEWLSFYQSWLSPYDFSGSRPLHDLRLSPDFELAAPNFATVSFAGVSWRNARLKSASFNDAEFSFNGGASQNDLGDAELQNAQFHNAKIAFTSFGGADLYRAVFDRSKLCKVDFSGANLNGASFWNVTLNEETENSLKDTAWWLAVGWPWSEIEKLAATRQADANSLDAVEQNKARVERLKKTKGFQREIEDQIKRLNNTHKDTLDRALALNGLAWTRAIWGIDVAGVKNEPPSGSSGADEIPIDAHQAAEQAVSLVRKLNGEGWLLANLQDTLAYTLMQSGQMESALKVFGRASQDDPTFLNTGEHLFRYAIAQYAASPDKQEAIKNFQAAIDQKGYIPTHELQNLKDYIFTVDDFVDALKSSFNGTEEKKLWPAIERTPEASNKTPCPAPLSETAK